MASVLWLGLLGVLVVGFVKEFGLAAVCTTILGEFSLDHFAQVGPGADGGVEVRFGYRLFGGSYWYVRIPTSRLASVEWSTGQLSSRYGRDMNDWQVALWYEHGDEAIAAKRKSWRHPKEELHLFGPTGRKELVGEFGRSFRGFSECGWDRIFRNGKGSRICAGGRYVVRRRLRSSARKVVTSLKRATFSGFTSIKVRWASRQASVTSSLDGSQLT